jgi:hypothetical protein
MIDIENMSMEDLKGLYAEIEKETENRMKVCRSILAESRHIRRGKGQIDKDQVALLYEKHRSGVKVANIVGCDQSRVYQILKELKNAAPPH